MFHSVEGLEAAVWRAFEVRRLRRYLPAAPATPRGENARMLAIAAARRLRASERFGLQRSEDAAYWKAVAPSALNKAREWRENPSFAPLPS